MTKRQQPYSSHFFNPDDPQEFICQRCGGYIGEIIEQNLLHVSGLCLTTAHGFCTNCGLPFHYTTTEKQLAQLITDVVARSKQNQ